MPLIATDTPLSSQAQSAKRENSKRVLLTGDGLQLDFDWSWWKATLRVAIAEGYLPRNIRHATTLSPSQAYGLGICAEDLLRMSRQVGPKDDPDCEDRQRSVLALIGLCKSGGLSIERQTKPRIGSKPSSSQARKRASL